jgi:hypothetical protein
MDWDRDNKKPSIGRRQLICGVIYFPNGILLLRLSTARAEEITGLTAAGEIYPFPEFIE